MNEDDTLDPERALWRPGRRTFILLGLGAAAATALGLKAEAPGSYTLHANTGTWTISNSDGKLLVGGEIAQVCPGQYTAGGFAAEMSYHLPPGWECTYDKERNLFHFHPPELRLLASNRPFDLGF